MLSKAKHLDMVNEMLRCSICFTQDKTHHGIFLPDCSPCHPTPPIVILSEAKDLARGLMRCFTAAHKL